MSSLTIDGLRLSIAAVHDRDLLVSLKSRFERLTDRPGVIPFEISLVVALPSVSNIQWGRLVELFEHWQSDDETMKLVSDHGNLTLTDSKGRYLPLPTRWLLPQRSCR